MLNKMNYINLVILHYNINEPENNSCRA